ncbi:hypothetical protein HNR54_000109 [Methanothermobacter sp. DSM 3267]
MENRKKKMKPISMVRCSFHETGVDAIIINIENARMNSGGAKI